MTLWPTCSSTTPNNPRPAMTTSPCSSSAHTTNRDHPSRTRRPGDPRTLTNVHQHKFRDRSRIVDVAGRPESSVLPTQRPARTTMSTVGGSTGTTVGTFVGESVSGGQDVPNSPRTRTPGPAHLGACAGRSDPWAGVVTCAPRSRVAAPRGRRQDVTVAAAGRSALPGRQGAPDPLWFPEHPHPARKPQPPSAAVAGTRETHHGKHTLARPTRHGREGLWHPLRVVPAITPRRCDPLSTTQRI
ncbi:hypothetical protein JOC24_006541 [Streptomyces sp. HB132]|nr:hypothetical protein [Streptomyces sp. HB132]